MRWCLVMGATGHGISVTELRACTSGRLAVWLHVVAVGGSSGSAAPREEAGDVDERGLLRQPGRCLVGVDGDVVVEVDDGPDRDATGGLSAPGAHLPASTKLLVSSTRAR